MSLPGPPCPATTIFPSGASATAFATSAPPKSTVCRPSPEKPASGDPSAFSRTIAASPPPTLLVEPTRTSFPSAWATMAVTVSLPPKSTVEVPVPAKVPSGVPSAFSRRVRMSWPAPP